MSHQCVLVARALFQSRTVLSIGTDAWYQRRYPLTVATVRNLCLGVEVGEPISLIARRHAKRSGHSFVVDASTLVMYLGALKTRLPLYPAVVVAVVYDDRVSVPRRYHWAQSCIIITPRAAIDSGTLTATHDPVTH